MFQGITRRRFVVVGAISSLLVAVAYANEREVIGFTGGASAVAGQSYSAQVSTNEAGISVTFSSNPPGLVSYTTTISGTSATVSVPTNVNAPAGSYVIVATPTSGGVSKQKTVVAAPGI